MAIDEQIDELFAGPADEFVARRDALAKELKASGDKDAAAEVKKLRRPTVAAWAVNQVALKHPAKLAELDDVGQQLRDAHEQLLDGKGNSAVREATNARRKVVDRLTDLAVKAIGPTGEAQRDAIATTFDAAVADADAAEAVRAGRLTKELDAPSGFGGLAFTADAPVSRATRKPATRKKDNDDSPDEPNEREDAQVDVEREKAVAARAAEREREKGEAEAKARARERKQLAAEAERAKSQLEAAQAEVTRLEHRLEDARTRLKDAEARAARAQRALDDLDDLDDPD